MPPEIVQRAQRWLHVLSHLDLLEPYVSTPTTPADRELIQTILAALGPIAEGIAAKDARIKELEEQLAAAGVAAAADEAADAAALAPVKEAVEAIAAALTGQVSVPGEEAPAPIPVEEVPAAVDTTPAPPAEPPADEPGTASS